MTDKSPHTLSNKQLADMTPWQIAEHYGISYNGDMNPLEHGGFFYSLEEWEDQGYARAVEFWEDTEHDVLVVQPGTIHKCEDMADAFRSIGVSADSKEDRGNVHCQIEACRAYGGIEPDGTAYPNLKNFDLETWKERNIWKSIRNWIEELKP